MEEVVERSLAPITSEHLERLSEIGLEVFDGLTAKQHAASRIYHGRLLMLALCQGGALHFVDGRNGVKDLDVWAFYQAHEDMPFPPRTGWRRDLGASSLGRHPDDTGFTGRRIDLFGRSIDVQSSDGPVEAVTRWLDERRTSSAAHLAKKAVVGLWPPNLRGKVIWPKPSAQEA